MKTVETAIHNRLVGDTTLQGFLGGAGRIYHAMELQQAQKPSLTYMLLSSSPGSINSDTVQTQEDTYVFMVFADNYLDIIYRLRRLLDGHRFAETAEAGNIQMFWEADEADLFDEPLQVGRKDVRYRVLLTPKAVSAV